MHGRPESSQVSQELQASCLPSGVVLAGSQVPDRHLLSSYSAPGTPVPPGAEPRTRGAEIQGLLGKDASSGNTASRAAGLVGLTNGD